MKGVLRVIGKPYTAPPPKKIESSTPTKPTPPAPPASGQNSTANVQMGAYFFSPNAITVPVGTVTFDLSNVGSTTHDMDIESGINQSSTQIDAGQSTTLKVVFTKPGTYSFLCDIGEHALLGMTGTITVTQK